MNLLAYHLTMMRSAISAAILLGLLVSHASGHGGTLHPGGPEQNGFLRAKVASCSKWVPASGVIKASKVVAAASRVPATDVKVSAPDRQDRDVYDTGTLLKPS